MYKDWYLWDKEVLYHRVRDCIKRLILLGTRELSVVERYLYYRGRADRMKFGTSGTKRTVRSREVSVS